MAWARFKKAWKWFGEKCVDYKLRGVRNAGRPKEIWSEVVGKHCCPFWIRLKHDDAVDHGKWRKSIKHIE